VDHTRHRFNAAVALVVTLVLLVALATACSAQATAGSGGPLAPSSSGPKGDTKADTSGASAAGAAKGASGADWARVLDILAFMRADRPAKPVVVLLGGSAARESTVDDTSWRAQIVKKSGPATLAWNMGSRNRTMAQNVAIVRNLPKVPTIVYIGINLGSFTSAQKRAAIRLPSPTPAKVSLKQPHQYGTRTTGVLSTAKKRALVKSWLRDRYPVFKRNFATSASVLVTLIKVCQARGFYPVLFELPRNTAVIGGALNAPTAKYRVKCRSLSAKYHVPWVSFVSAAKLPNRSFYDLWHLVESGRTRWQALLSAKTAKILNSAAFSGGGS
jgi:hypothetical protein